MEHQLDSDFELDDHLVFTCCPVKVIRALYIENVVEETHLDRVLEKPTREDQRQEIQKQMNAIIGSRPNIQIHPLKTFATLLMRFDDLSNGRRLLQLACKLMISLFLSTGWVISWIVSWAPDSIDNCNCQRDWKLIMS